jgi:hypothetical protein
MCSVDLGDSRMNGYVPSDMGIGGDDYIDFKWCLECGQLQGKFPLPGAGIEKDITDEKVAEFFDNHFTQGSTVDAHRRLQSDLIDAANEESPKFGAFMREFFEYNTQRKPQRVYPSVERFVQMFRGKDADLGSQWE